jgi:hypothetical protein
MKAFVSAIALALATASAGTAFAAAPHDKGPVQPWTKDNVRYEFKHPLDVTCKELAEVDEVYQPYVIAWLSGHESAKSGDKVVAEEFTPVSVPIVIDECTARPDMKVLELVQTKIK